MPSTLQEQTVISSSPRNGRLPRAALTSDDVRSSRQDDPNEGIINKGVDSTFSKKVPGVLRRGDVGLAVESCGYGCQLRLSADGKKELTDFNATR
jgi:hypothetical protein